MIITVAFGTSTPTSTTVVDTNTSISPSRNRRITSFFFIRSHLAVKKSNGSLRHYLGLQYLSVLGSSRQGVADRIMLKAPFDCRIFDCRIVIFIVLSGRFTFWQIKADQRANNICLFAARQSSTQGVVRYPSSKKWQTLVVRPPCFAGGRWR